ncbi:MAG TPA: 3',5'-cyclic-nucleotide phosphodiesterase [Acidobacteria bacterium]|nr:3',5'-cyclic-nucleotide phosphodiesterase [Acidobacteriota bacterium]
MRMIAHISDLHFGMEDERIAGRLLEDLEGIDPSVVVISGDLTQRARKRQFEAAGAFIRKITAPCLVVPGNHDIPLYDVIRRTLTPLHRYRHHITADLNPVFEDDELIVLGANTARAANFKNGRISEAQIQMLADRLCSAGRHLFKVLVSHHPFLPPLDHPYAASVGRGGLAAEALEPCGLDLLLAGHYHRGYMGDLQSRDSTVKRPIIVAQAGTAISKRTRGERNSYDRIIIDPPDLCFDRYAWDGRGFVKTKTTRFKKVGGAWQLQPQDICGTRSGRAQA